MMTTNFRNLQPLLAPRAIAVVGASPRGNRGSRVLENLDRFGFAGDVVVVHPKHEEVLGRRCVPSVADLPDGIDLVVVAVSAERALDVVQAAGERGIGAVVVIGSGFGEGEKGGDRLAALVGTLEKYDMVGCGPNCYGTLDLASGAAAYSGRIVDPLPAGNVALVLQSGALTHAVTDSAIGRGLAVSAIVTTGNEASATVSDYVAHYAEDASTEVIGVFIEGLRDADKFAAACRLARSRGKAVVVLASGRSESGRRAAMAHTGAISGGSAALDGLLATSGAIRVDDLDELRETLLLFSALAGRTPAAAGVATLSISGGACGLTADTAEAVGVDLPVFGPETTAELVAVLPDFAAVNNPLDVTGAAAEDPEILGAALRVAAADPAIGLVAFAMNVGLAGPGQEDFYRTQAEILARQAAADAKPVVLLALTGGALDQGIAAVSQEAGVPVVMGLRPALKAISSWLRWPGLVAEERPQVERADRWPSEYPVAAGRDALDALVAAGIPVARYDVAADPAAAAELVASVGERVVLKIDSPDIAHKTEVGGVRLGVRPETALTEAEWLLSDVRAAEPEARIDGILIQEMVAGERLECLIGVVADSQVGLCMSIAPGGVLAELMGPAAARPVPLTRKDAEELIDASVLGTLLAGYRGGPAFDRDALVETAVRFSALAASLPGLAAAEMNPLLVGEEGQGVAAVDCLLIRDEEPAGA
ncbi:CoA-binding protein [Nocardioides marmoriginsengisoli]|uniref:CoA-binding protein n=1 Tax=Nocardioides marmoriginsengisoli TaxID=661483 RepID=A0A3N0CCN1_9ACTN|nr:acetate--CoA ligase family protein [Nocardioides marmoriginsengisoli]RNL60806.1 CoA-binding protein [Nocardioides marmoriginsengisoli]